MFWGGNSCASGVTNFMELEDVGLTVQLNGGEPHGLAQKPGVEIRLENLNLRGKLGEEGRLAVFRCPFINIVHATPN